VASTTAEVEISNRPEVCPGNEEILLSDKTGRKVEISKLSEAAESILFSNELWLARSPMEVKIH